MPVFRRPRADPAVFDSFYLGSRRRLLLQCLALTGDLEASRSAVRDAFVAAQQHWRKVSQLEEPEDWVRPRAWAIAQRRSVARIWRREKGLTPQQTAVLDALSSLPDAQRRTVLLAHLAALSLPGIGRELGQTQPVIEQQLQQATVALALALDCDSALIRAQLESLAPIVTRPGLPRVTAVRRSAHRRHRVHQLTASTLGLLLALGAGWFVTSGGGAGTAAPRVAADSSVPAEHPLTRALLLTAAELHQPRGSHRRHAWRTLGTSDGTQGAAPTPCQPSRYADDRGTAALIRTFRSQRSSERVVQTVEVSRSLRAAATAYRTTLDWYANCSADRGQLLHTWTVHGLGDRSEAVQLRTPAKTWTVVVARTGRLTTRTALGSKRTKASLRAVLSDANTAVGHLCTVTAAGACSAGRTRATPTLPPVADVPGMLAATDLPPLPGVHRPWVATSPASPTPNLAATPCDHASFRSAATARSRTFLVPEAHLPQRFGLTETYGRFRSSDAVRRFFSHIESTMTRCAADHLGASVSSHRQQPHGPAGSAWSLWRETTEVNDHNATVSYWMGVIRSGRYVAQVTLTPVGRYDVSEPEFAALVVRARDRLRELPVPTPRHQGAR